MKQIDSFFLKNMCLSDKCCKLERNILFLFYSNAILLSYSDIPMSLLLDFILFSNDSCVGMEWIVEEPEQHSKFYKSGIYALSLSL